jgi:hypothetical protein
LKQLHLQDNVLTQISHNLWRVANELPELFITFENQAEIESLKSSPRGLAVYLRYQEFSRVFNGYKNARKVEGKLELLDKVPIPDVARERPLSSGDTVEIMVP